MTEQTDTTISGEAGGEASGANGHESDGSLSSRRAMFASTAAAVVTGVAVSSGRAHAANGDPILAGDGTVSTSRTELFGPSFVVTDGEASGSLARRVANVVTGVHGFTSDEDRSRAVWGLDQTEDGVGVYGQHWDRNAGTGVYASSGNGPGLVAEGTGADVVLRGTGELRFVGSQPIGPTSPGSQGTLAREEDGTLWYCYSGNRWQRIAGRSRASTFVAIDPTRVFDSRSPRPVPGALPAGGARVLSVRSGRDLRTGGVIDANLVPFDATAVAYNLTAARTINSGFLSIAPGDAGDARASALNWTASGQVVANAGIVRLDVNGNVKVICGGANGATDFVIDVTGYYN